jgi:hypothetical protein
MSVRTNGRDRVSNGRLSSGDVDLRSAPARRFRYLVSAYSSELGDGLTELERATVRQAATVQIEIERLQAAMLKGDSIDPDMIIRLSSEHRRLLGALVDRAGRNKEATKAEERRALLGF